MFCAWVPSFLLESLNVPPLAILFKNDYPKIEVIRMSNRANLKTRTAYSSTLATPLWEALEALQQSSRIPKSKLLDEAVELLLHHHQKE